MAVIKDSDAVLEKERLFAQHQAALTLLQGLIDNPKVESFDWLDIGCGKGQIIVNLEDNLGIESRNKICYSGFDIKEEFLNITLRKAETLKLKHSGGQIGDISNFGNLHPVENKFDFITLTNSIHEFHPLQIPTVLFDCLLRLKSEGLAFFYDMEHLPFQELGAIAWTRDEIHEVLKDFLKNIGTDYAPTPGKWKHKTTNGWNIQINKAHIKVSDEDLISRKEEIIKATEVQVLKTLQTKLENCETSLESITKYGTETEDEESLKERLLHDFWSLNRIKEVRK